MRKILLLSAVSLIGLSTAAHAEDFTKALTEGKFNGEARARSEWIDQDTFANDAFANTVRLRMGYTTGSYYGLGAQGELQSVQDIATDNYNSGVNGKVAYPAVGDPDGTELRLANVFYTGVKNLEARVGRQDIALGNERFVGTANWRQHGQNFDAASASYAMNNFTVGYNYLWGFNTTIGISNTGGTQDVNGHILSGTYDVTKATGFAPGTVGAYAILHDNSSVAANSTKTFGVNVDGSTTVGNGIGLGWYAEYARQSDYKSNAANFDVNYIHVVPSVMYKGFKVWAGYELLGSDNSGTVALNTSTGTSMGFNGYAEKFNGAPPTTGLQDIYGGISYTTDTANEYTNGITFEVAYHDFTADQGSADFGTEADIGVSKTFNDKYTVGVKYANYDADTFSTDTQKATLTAGVKF